MMVLFLYNILIFKTGFSRLIEAMPWTKVAIPVLACISLVSLVAVVRIGGISILIHLGGDAIAVCALLPMLYRLGKLELQDPDSHGHKPE
jgi:hypothetical protein